MPAVQSSLNWLKVKGVRSFGPDKSSEIEFGRPLTLLHGPNGAGKTVRHFIYIVKVMSLFKYYSISKISKASKDFQYLNTVRSANIATSAYNSSAILLFMTLGILKCI